MATKLLINDDLDMKDRIHVHLNTIDVGFAIKFQQWQSRHGKAFDCLNQSLQVHEIFKRLNDGLEPRYDAKFHANLPETGQVKSALEFGRRTSEL